MQLYLTVALRGADPTALTAEYALRRHLGFADQITALRRLTLWRFDLAEADQDAARRQAAAWVTQSQLFVNPNQHSYELLDPAQADSRPAPERQVWIAVQDEPDLDGAAATRLVRERLGGTALREAHRATVWQLELAGELAPARRQTIAEEVAVARGRRHGLLANPHCQSARVFAGATPAAVGRALWLG
jgi:hypothetical protein